MGLAWESPIDAPGTLRLVSSGGQDPAEAYEQWADSHGLAGADRDKNADPDNDSLSNLREYAFGGDPSTGDAEPWCVSRDGPNLAFSWLQRTDGSVSYSVWEHADLVTGPWLVSAAAVQSTSGPTLPAGYQWKMISVPAIGQQFFRIEATMP